MLPYLYRLTVWLLTLTVMTGQLMAQDPPIRLNSFNAGVFAISPDKSQYAVVPYPGLSGAVKIVDAGSGAVTGEIEDRLFNMMEPSAVNRIVYSRIANQLFVFEKKKNETEELNVWDLDTYSLLRRFTGRKIYAISPSEKYLFLETESRQLAVLDFQKGTQIRIYQSESPENWSGAAISPDDKYLVVLHASGEIRAINLFTEKTEKVFEKNAGPGELIALKFSNKGDYFFTYNNGNSEIDIWEYPGNTLLNTIELNALVRSDDNLSLDWADNDEQLVYVARPLEEQGPVIGLLNIYSGQTDEIYILPKKASQFWVWNVPIGVSAGDKKVSVVDFFSSAIGHIDYATKTVTNTFSKINDFSVKAGTFTSDHKRLFHANGDGEIFQWDLSRGNYLGRFLKLDMAIEQITFSTDHTELIVKGQRNFRTDSSQIIVYTIDAASGREIAVKNLGKGGILSSTQTNYVPTSDGSFYVSGGFTGPAVIGNKKNQFISMASLRGSEKDFVVFTEDGRFDGTERGIRELLYAVEDGKMVSIDKYRAKYHTPGLLRTFLFPDSKETPASPPVIAVKPGQNSGYQFTVTNHNKGGIGPIEVYVNDRLVHEDARRLVAENPSSLADKPSVIIPIDPLKLAIDPSKDHTLRIVAYDKGKNVSTEHRENLLKSVKGTVVQQQTPGGDQPATMESGVPNLWVIVVGVSNYDNSQLNLRFSAKDAEAMAKALQVAGSALFDAKRTHTIKLTSESPPAQKPTKANILRSLRYVQERASYQDVVLVYLSGHGIAHRDNEDDFYFLAANARTTDYGSSEIRESQSLSGTELREFLNGLKAQKQVLIMDACASGAFANQLIAGRDLSEAVRRGIQRMRNRTATYVLTGNANDKKSYESSAYGQGLLTYTLLQGMRGAALREGKFVDVSTLFQYARDQVELLSQEIDLVQVPVIVAPAGSESFDIGLLASPQYRALVPVNEAKPVFKKTNLVQAGAFADLLDLSPLLDEMLYELSYQDNAPLVFVQTDYPNAYHIAGEYTKTGKQLSLNGKIFQNKTPVATIAYKGESDGLAAYLLEQIGEAVR